MIITYVLVVSAMLIDKQAIDEPLYATRPFRTQAACKAAEAKYNEPAFKVRTARCVPVVKDTTHN